MKKSSFQLILFIVAVLITIVSTRADAHEDNAILTDEGYKGTTFRKDLVGVHPRIIIGTEIPVGELRRRASDSNYKTMYDNLIEYANSMPARSGFKPGTDTQVLNWRFSDLALTYLVTGENQYKEKIRTYVLEVAKEPMYEEESGGFRCAYALMAMGYAYDWAYDAFSEEERVIIRESITRNTKYLYNLMLTGIRTFMSDFQNNHHQIRLDGLMTGIHAVMGDVDDPELVTIYNYAENQLIDMMKWIAPDGSLHEAPHYQMYGYQHIIRMLTAHKSVSGVDLFGEVTKNVAYFRAYIINPGLRNLNPWGDDGGGLGDRYNIFLKIASEAKDSALQGFFLDLYEKAAKKVFGTEGWMFLFYDDSLAPTRWDKPGYAHFNDLEMVNFRTGWNDDDISIYFKTGSYGGHRMNEWRDSLDTWVNVAHDKPDAQNIGIFFGGKQWGEYPPDLRPKKGGTTFNRVTRFHNTITIDGVGQRGEIPKGLSFLQPIEDMANMARVSEYFGTDGYSFTTGDAKNAYELATKFDRSVLFIDGRYFVSFDDIGKANGKYSFEFNWHNNGAWTGDANNGYVINQDGRSMELHVKSLVPTTGTLTPPYTDSRMSRMGSWLVVKNASPTTEMQYMSVYFPVIEGEKLASTPEFTDDNK